MRAVLLLAFVLSFAGCKKEEVDSRSKILPSFTYSESVNGTIVFSGKSDNNISIDEFTWTFGDGEVANSVTGTYPKTYKKNGIYDVKLEVKDRSGRRESVTNKVMVKSLPI